jgi:hypothetical protein
LTFRSVKLLGWRGRERELEADANPVGLFVLGYLEGRRLKDDEAGRAERKRALIRRLKGHGLSVVETGRWIGLFDWLLPLSAYNVRLWEEADESDKEGMMAVVSFLEQRGMEKGLEKGRREVLLKGIGLGLKLKFKEEGLAQIPAVEKIEDAAVLAAIFNAIDPAASLDDVRKLIPAPSNGAE